MKKLFISAAMMSVVLTFAGCNYFRRSPVTIKVMSYNIRHGADMSFKMNLERQAEIIKNQAPDFVGLQEVDNNCSRSNSVDQARKLGRLTDMTGTFGKFMNLQGGQYGMGTLCKLPLVSSKVVKIPPAKLEPRCAILNIAKLSNGTEIAFANVHFDWLQDQSQNRINQAKALLKEVDALKLPAVILGDFNTTPDSPTMNYFAQQGFVFMDKGEDHLTFQGKGEPSREIDHVIYRSSDSVTLEGVSIDVLDEPVASDHRPVVAKIMVK